MATTRNVKSKAPAPAKAGVGAAAPSEQLVLAGSSTLPSTITIGGVETQLGAVVAAAHEASGLSAADWNAVAAEERDALLTAQIEAMEAEAADAGGASDEEPVDEAAPVYPRTVKVWNHSHIFLAEPISGVYVGPGGSAETTLHDPDHAHRVRSNFEALAQANFLKPEALRIDGLPE